MADGKTQTFPLNIKGDYPAMAYLYPVECAEVARLQPKEDFTKKRTLPLLKQCTDVQLQQQVGNGHTVHSQGLRRFVLAD